MNRRRLAAAAAALGVVALVVFAPAAAQAAPVQAPPAAPGLCTTAELANPANYFRCAQAAANAITNAATCLQAPTPTSPDAGFAGLVSIRPDANLYSGVGGQYTDYGSAGYGLTTYGLGCLTITHATGDMQTTFADGMMQASAAWLAFSNTGRHYAYAPTSAWGWMDSGLNTAVDALYQHLWLTGAALFIAFAGVAIIAMAHRGTVSAAARTAGWAILVTVVVTLVAHAPSVTAGLADRGATAALGALHSVAGIGPAATKPGSCILPGGPDACVDHRTSSDITADNITTALMYRSWLECELGSADSATAKKYGPILFDAQALTWSDGEKIKKNPAQRAVIYAAKAQQWNNIAAVIKDEDPQAYEYLQGLHGTDRVETAFMTVIEVFLFTSFDLAASLILLLSFGMFRLVLLSIPVTGTFGAFEPASGAFRRSLAVFVSAGRNILVFGAASTIYLFLIDVYFAADAIPGVLKVVLMGLTTIAAWMLIRPVRGVFRAFGADTSDMKRGPTSRLLIWGAGHVSDSRRVHTGEVLPPRPGTDMVRAESRRSYDQGGHR